MGTLELTIDFLFLNIKRARTRSHYSSPCKFGIQVNYRPDFPFTLPCVDQTKTTTTTCKTNKKTIGKVTPSRHVGLVTFNGEVCLIGDGSSDSRVVAGDRLSDKEALREVGRAYPLSRPISEARERLSERLFALEEGGPTALGPAVVAGLSMLKVRSKGGGAICVWRRRGLKEGAFDRLNICGMNVSMPSSVVSIIKGVHKGALNLGGGACDRVEGGHLAQSRLQERRTYT